MTETLTDTGIEALEAALRESQLHERALAAEVDSLPEKIRAATQAHARRLADASRQGKDALARADKESEVPLLREREASLPLERWSASIRTAAVEMELNAALEAEHQSKYETAREKILEAKEEADRATARFERVRSELVQGERGVNVYSGYVAAARKKLSNLEAAYPGA
jgi:chromosome segregation ATPase